ncbi:uncharacterized protein [Euwallacea fornicatus]|uniref:uncharacterized protein isoform X2 n=1 Tax=Euwallacea fornicatus TaxID=995702 RepID=UPI00338E0639
MFKFNFQDKNDKKEDNIKDCDPKTEEKSWIESEEIIPKNQGDIVKKILANCSHNSMQYNEILLKYYTTEDVLNVLRNNIVEKPVLNNSLSVINADQSHSDLISSVYEVREWYPSPKGDPLTLGHLVAAIVITSFDGFMSRLLSQRIKNLGMHL